MKRKRSAIKVNKKRDGLGYLYKKLVARIILTATVFILLYFWIFGIFSNINNFWSAIFGNAKNTISRTDTIAPPKPFLKRIPKATNKNSVEISGVAEANAKVALFKNGDKLEETVADSDGSFDFGAVSIEKEKTSFYVIAVDDAGNKSVPSNTYEVVFDNIKPKIEVSVPEEGETYKNRVRTLRVTGKTEPKSIVSVNGTHAVTDENGDFYAQIIPKEGNNEVLIKVTDRAGNENTAKIGYIFKEE